MGWAPIISLAISAAASYVSSLFIAPTKVRRPDPNLRVPRSEYDSPLPKIYGKVRIEGNKFWPDSIEKMYRIEEITTNEGGKGGGGGGKGGQQVESTNVYGTWAVVFCQGRVEIDRLIINGQEFDTNHAFFDQYCVWFDGLQTTPWASMQILDTGGEAEIAYKGLAYVGLGEVPLEIYGNQIPTQMGAILYDLELGETPDVALVVRDICERAGIDSDKIDVTDIIGKYTLRDGLTVSQNGESSRKVLEDLMQFYLFTAVETTDGVIAFKSFDRGNFTPTGFNVNHYLPINENKILEITRTSKSQLPNKASIKFFNTYQKYDSDEVVEYFQEYSQENDFRIDTQLSTFTFEAKQQARRILKFITARQRYTYTFKLPAVYYSSIELLGCYQLPNAEIIQVDKITLNPDYTIDVSARRYTGINDFLYTPSNPPNSSSIPSLIDPLDNGIPDVYFLDIPVINPNNPPNTLYICASATATVNISFDGGASYVASVNHTATSTIGECETALPPAIGLDTVNTLTVQLSSGILSSISISQFDTGSNLALIARQNNGIWEGELIRFRDVLPLGNDRYTISYLQRGDYNTQNFNSNNVGDKFFLLKGNGAYYSYYANTTNVGQPITYQPVIAPWQNLNTTPTTTINTVGNSYSPPPVTNIQSFIDVQGNIKLTWNYNSTTSVFNNTQENISFEIDIEPSIRTLTTNNRQVIYLGNLRNGDGVTIPFDVNIYGVSSLIGRGSASFYTVDNPIFVNSTTFFDNPNSSFSQIVGVNTDLFQLNSNIIYEVDTSLTPLTLLMPTEPNLGDRVYIIDGPGLFLTNPCTLDGGGFDLEGQPLFSLNQLDEHIEFVFNGNQWIYLNRFFYATTVDNADNLGGQPPSYYLDRANHTGTQAIVTISGLQDALDALQPLLVNQVNLKSINNNTLLGTGDLILDPSTIPNFDEGVDDRVASLLIAGTNISLDYSDVANTLTINSTGGGSGTNELAQYYTQGTISTASSINVVSNKSIQSIKVFNNHSTSQDIRIVSKLGSSTLTQIAYLLPAQGTINFKYKYPINYSSIADGIRIECSIGNINYFIEYSDATTDILVQGSVLSTSQTTIYTATQNIDIPFIKLINVNTFNANQTVTLFINKSGILPREKVTLLSGQSIDISPDYSLKLTAGDSLLLQCSIGNVNYFIVGKL
jgi:hypothetical protein